MKFLHIDGSSREDGNASTLAKYLLQDLPFEEIALRDYQIQLITDERHSEQGFVPLGDDYDRLLPTFLEADYVVFSSPIYWYGLSAQLKAFIDRWSESMRIVSDFQAKIKHKKVFLIIVGGDDPYRKGLPTVQQFEYIAEFLELDLQGHLIGIGNKPDDILQDHIALDQAKQINQQLQHIKESVQ